MTRLFVATLVIVICAVACAHDDPRFVGFFAAYKNCRARYAEIDARIDAAGVRDAGYYRVPGFPYLRTDRTLASFRNEVHSIDEVGAWVRHMREYDQEAREFEYVNLGLSIQEAAILRFDLLNCGRGLAGIELDDPANRARLIAAVVPPDDYSDTARTLGLYPLAVPLLRARVTQHQTAVMRAFARPLGELGQHGPLLLWQVKPVEDRSLVANGYGDSLADELGFPGLFDSAWRALAEVNAPALWIDTDDERDRPGAPTWSASGATVDASQPLVYYQITFTRFGTERLTQINYFVWFKGHGDPSAGSVDDHIDGMIWRVTLDQQARPLAYESLRASGSDHLWFATGAVTPRIENSYWHEPALFPQPQVPDGLKVLRLQSATHALQRVVGADQVAATESHVYELRRYEDLLMLPRPDGSSRSLFGPDGLVAGSRGADGILLRASGIRQPGAPRQLGHHAISYIGRSEFDDPFVLESVFVPPPAAPATD
ncbi:MAG: hypothetical protein JWR16_2967 [Nevskia sp.]|nr:hypothetical protein [Nevskia sp.]